MELRRCLGDEVSNQVQSGADSGFGNGGCRSQPNAFGAKVLVPTSLLLANWRTLLSNYHDKTVIDFLSYGWPINYIALTRPVSLLHNHPSASKFASHVQD